MTIKLAPGPGFERRFAPHRASALWRSHWSLSPLAGKQLFPRPHNVIESTYSRKQ